MSRKAYKEAWPPSPEESCKRDCDEIKGKLRELSDFSYRQGYPGFSDIAREASDRIDNLTKSYLSACRDNDRLRRELEQSAS